MLSLLERKNNFSLCFLCKFSMLNFLNFFQAHLVDQVTKHLCKQYSSLSEAEDDLKIDYIFSKECSSTYHESTPNVKEKQYQFCLESLSPLFKCSPMAQSTSSVGDSVLNVVDAFKHSMTPRLKQQFVNYLFKLMVVDIWGYDFYSFVHDDFLNVSLNAMYTLKSAGKSNLLHSLSQCFYRANQDSQSRMALNKMPLDLSITTSVSLPAIRFKVYMRKNITLRGLKLCSHILDTDGYVYLEGQLGNMKHMTQMNKPMERLNIILSVKKEVDQLLQLIEMKLLQIKTYWNVQCMKVEFMMKYLMKALLMKHMTQANKAMERMNIILSVKNEVYQLLQLIEMKLLQIKTYWNVQCMKVEFMMKDLMKAMLT